MRVKFRLSEVLNKCGERKTKCATDLHKQDGSAK